MGGEVVSPKAKPKQLRTAQSTPHDKQDGVGVPLQYAKLAKYEVNVRSFHPNTKFEPMGLRFHGDSRGFSLGRSWFKDDEKTQPTDPTSRIWQRFTLDLNASVFTDKSTGRREESNPSQADDSFPYNLAGGKEEYKDPKYKPRGTLSSVEVSKPHGGQKIVSLRTWYGGENHAFTGSRAAETATRWVSSGWTPVPTLDVSHELFVQIERVNLYMDIVSIVYGDGFPNCEGFIEDATGGKVFLGTHVRIGMPITHLGGNDNKRVMWANAIRVQIDSKGNFGEKLWVFGHLLGGSHALRDNYPAGRYNEECTPAFGSEPRLHVNPFNDKPALLIWGCGKPEWLQKRDAKVMGAQPLHISAFTPLDTLRSALRDTYYEPPVHKTTRSEWNDWHLHRDPNGGRAPDEFDVPAEKWRK